MVGETGTTWYLMLEILNLPATPNQQTCLNEKITNTNTHTHTHTHTHTKEVKKEQFATQARLSYLLEILHNDLS